MTAVAVGVGRWLRTLGGLSDEYLSKTFTLETPRTQNRRRELRDRLFGDVVEQLSDEIANYWIFLGSKNGFENRF